MPVGPCQLCICDICYRNRLFLLVENESDLWEQIRANNWIYKRREGKEDNGLVSKIIYICPKCQEVNGE